MSQELKELFFTCLSRCSVGFSSRQDGLVWSRLLPIGLARGESKIHFTPCIHFSESIWPQESFAFKVAQFSPYSKDVWFYPLLLICIGASLWVFGTVTQALVMFLVTPLLGHLLRWFVKCFIWQVYANQPQTNWGLSFMVPGVGIASAGIVMFFLLAPSPEAAGFQQEKVLNNFITKSRSRKLK